MDRGFRDCIVHLKNNNIACFMPNLLGPKEKQFTDLKANDSRAVTMIRYLVEQVNGRIKNKFKFFRNVISNNHLDNLMEYFKIACSIINAFSQPLQIETVELNRKIELALARKSTRNVLQEKVLNARFKWTTVNKNNIPFFPTLDEEDLFIITLGSYQLKMAKDYVAFQLESNPLFEVKMDKKLRIIMAKIQSKYRKRKRHQCYVE